ncbi:MAG: hypothetical protein ACREJ5_08275 [Geminicoccaceae bacterium]
MRSQGGNWTTGRGHAMAVTPPAHDPSRSPGRTSPQASAAATGRPGFGLATRFEADGEGTLELGLMRAVIQDGVLMVLGPDGDPVPPQAFGAAAMAQPDALVRLADGPPIRAERIAAVLDAQRGGRLGSGGGGDEAWIKAMLGIGPRPEMARDEDLLAERHAVETIAFGKELMISSPAGGTFLIAEARGATPASVRLLGESGEPIALGAVVARLLGRAGRHGAGKTHAKVNEVTLPDCKTWIEGDALVIDLPEIGALHFSRHDPAAGQGPSVSVFMPDGETATIDELISALCRSLTSPQAHASPGGQAGPTMTDPSSGADRCPTSGPKDPTSDAPPPVPLAIRLPDGLGAKEGEVALLVVRRLPPGARLSAGVAGDDGSWLLSPRHLGELALVPPSGWTRDLTLEIVAIAVRNRDGELASASNTMEVALRPAPRGHAPAPIPIAIDPRVLSGDDAPLDAIIVRDLPARATLSAGAYDPAIDGWVLLPRQVGALTVTPGPRQTEDFTLTLLGVRLSDGRARSRLLARIPVAIPYTDPAKS